MAKYIVQLRRGTAEEWATIGADIVPLVGELVLEIDDSGQNLHRLKIGDGKHLYSELPYLSVDSFILPKPVSVTVRADRWEQFIDDDGQAVPDTYCQAVTVDNALTTSNSKVDLHPDPIQVNEFYDLGIVFTTENRNGLVSVHVVGGMPNKTYTMQATVTEVVIDGGVT